MKTTLKLCLILLGFSGLNSYAMAPPITDSVTQTIKIAPLNLSGEELYQLYQKKEKSAATESEKIEALLLLEEANAKNNPQATYALAQNYLEGRFTPVNLEKAAQLIGKYKLESVQSLQISALEENADYAHFLTLKQQVSQQDPKALYELGQQYENGDHVPKNINKALNYYELAVAQNHVPTMIHIANLYETGERVPKKPEVARAWIEKATRSGDKDATKRLIYYYENGIGGETDYPLALNMTEKLAVENDSEAMFNLYRYYHEGIVAPKNDAEAQKWLQMAANHNNITAQLQLAALELDGAEDDQEKAFAIYQKLAQQGNPEAQLRLGEFYIYDLPEDQRDYLLGANWFEKAAKQGNLNAAYQLGLLYLYGRGTPQSYVKAAEWLTLAADKNDAEAQFNLAAFYAYGLGVQKNYPKAIELLEKSAQQGNSDAAYNLGFIYASGEEGTEQNYQKAYYWLSRSAADNNADAQYNLGILYSQGLGIEMNEEKALHYFTLACENKNADGCNIINKATQNAPADKTQTDETLQITEVNIQPKPKVEKTETPVESPKTKPKAEEDFILYQVKRGDLGSKIAKAHKVTEQDLIRWNNLKSLDYIQAGQTLKIYKK